MQFRIKSRYAVESTFNRQAIDSASGVYGLGRVMEQCVPRKRRLDKCPACNWTREQVQQTRLFGCAACYEIFEDEI